MGTVAAAAAAAAEALELEAKRTEDSSWLPCRVSLKPSFDAFTSSGLVLDFDGHFGEVIFTKEEAMKRLRIRSTPLQGDECFHVKEGEHVLASQTTKFGILFFDAEVEKVYGVRHSKRNPCRCTFRIKWLCKHAGVRAETVPASSIRKLATTTIDSHTTVVEFLNSFQTFDSSGASSFASLSEEPDFEFDLEKQIEELSRLADVSEKGVPEGHSVELTKVDLTGQVRHRTLASQVGLLNDQGPSEQTNSRRTTRSRKKISVESETIVSSPKAVTVEPDRPILSPLGARAALASLMYKPPPVPEFTAYNLEREGFTFTNAVQNTTSTITDSGPSIQKKLSIKDGLLPNVKDSPAPVDLKQTKVRRSGRRDASNSFLQTEENNVGSKSESPRNTTRASRLAAQKGMRFSNNEVELNSSCEEIKSHSPTPTHTPRFTRSAIQKETVNETMEISKRPQERKLGQSTNSWSTRPRNQNGTEHSDDEIYLKSSSDETKLLIPTQTPRSMQSAIQKETRHATEDVLQKAAVNGSVDIDKGLQEIKLAKGKNSRSTRLRNQNGIEHSNDEINLKSSSEETNLLSPTQTPRLTRSAIQRGTRHATSDVLQKAVNSSVDTNEGLQERNLARGSNSRFTRLRNQTGIGHPDDEIDPRSSSKEMELLSPTRTTRLTRSEIQKGARNETVEVNKEHEESQSAQDLSSDSMREDFVKPQNNEIRKKPLPSDDEIKSSVAQESNKKQRVSKDKGEIAETGANLQGKSSVSSKASLVLRSSPRTRSQKKPS